VTCPNLARRAMAPAEVLAHLRAVVDGDRTTAQLVRFALTGVLATGVQVLLFTSLASDGVLLAHLVSWGVSTALANELHRRRTFHAGERVGPLAAQLEGGGLALLGLLATTGSLAWLTTALPTAGLATQTLLVLAVTGAVGLLRFVALRWSFVIRRPQPA
jgi:putative flippase GtrA